MHLISSSFTFFHKRIFPVIWFGFISIFLFGLSAGVINDGKGYGILLIPLGMTVFGFFIMKKFVWNLVDEVWDDGDSLIVKNKRREARIELLNIININHTKFTNPESITLTLRTPCEFGKIVKFSPPIRMFQFSEHPLVTELIERIDQKRQNAEQGIPPEV